MTRWFSWPARSQGQCKDNEETLPLTSTGLWRGQDSASCFIKGSLMLEEFAYKYDTYEELLDAVIKV